MKTLNTQENVPDYFYVFLEFNGLVDEINKYNFELTKRICSSGIMTISIENSRIQDFIDGNFDYLPYISSGKRTGSFSSYILKVINDYNVEHNLEIYRKAVFPKYPSRLSGVFAFGDYETCDIVASKYSWNLKTVRKFRLVDLGPLNKAVKIIKVNMDIVSLLRGVLLPSFSVKDQNILLDKYWSGAGDVQVDVPSMDLRTRNTLNSGVLYEYLIEGILEEV